MTEETPPLEDVRVVDLTQYEAGPSATQILAWLGADVIKVEPPRGDPARSLAGANEQRDSMFFVLYNQSKRSVALDLGREEDRARLDRLLESADVLAENFAPGTLERLGLGPERLARDFPGLVVASIRGYRSGGRWSEYKSLDFVGQATGGAMSATGERGREPVRLGATVADSGAGLHLAIGILAALHRKQRTGRGGRVEVALQDVVVSLMRTAMVPTYVTGAPVERMGSDYPATAPSGLHPCAPGGPNDHVYLLLSSNRHWEGLLRAIGRQDLIGDERYARQSKRNACEAEVREIVSAWTRTRGKLEAMERLSEVGVPCGAVLDTCEVLANPHLRESGMIVEQDHPQWGKIPVPGCPIRLDGPTPRIEPAPGLGAHTREIVGE
jgi:formyl-CoA transferase